MESQLLDLIGMVYDAAQDESIWLNVLGRLGEILQCHIVEFELVSTDQTASVAASFGMTASNARDFVYYSTINPWMPLLKDVAPGTVGLSHEKVPDKQYLKSEYYNEFGKRIDQRYGLAGVVLATPTAMSIIGAVRDLSAGPCTEEDAALMRALIPHLARSLRMHGVFARLGAETTALLDGLDRLVRGFVLLDACGKVLRANRAAERMANQRDGLSLSSQGLRCNEPSQSAALQKMIHDAALTASGMSQSAGGTLLISRPSLRRPYIAAVSPHRSSPEGLAAVLLIDPEESPEPSAEIAARLFGFTRSETRLALLLAKGTRLEDAADQLGTTMNTVRTHTRRMLSKAGVRRQTDLVLLLNKIPAQPQS
jgi:DNA-binding CsgD family transcriptional regulator